ncbi:MAG: O-antigen ligase family protein [Opitutae bacterium]|nr:O-antigen ligase family protein [Opitutae bacterium]
MPDSTIAPERRLSVSGEPSRQRTRLTTGLELAVALHVGVLTVFTSWAFGGQIPWARSLMVGWATGGFLLFVIALGTLARRHGASPLGFARHLWPLLLFDLVVGASCFNPSFKPIVRDGEHFWALTTPPFSWLPSSARPELTLRELWQFNALVVSAFNLYLVLDNRRILRSLLLGFAANAVVLAVFGTFQKLVGAKGLWFGLVKSPNDHFFSTFVYHNHWGSFVLLHTAVCLGLLFHYVRRGGHRDVWHSPVMAGAVATLLLAASVPLSSSRSSSVLVCLFLLGALVHFLARLIRRRRDLNESPLLPVAGIIFAAALALGATLYLGRDVIQQRAQLTARQLEQIKAENSLNARLLLYRDTWRMAAEKPWFGWGLETYADVFRIYNSAPTPVHGWRPFYAQAHNDWLQSLAESGFVGTTLLGLLGLAPLLAVPWRRVESVLPRYLLAGCGLLLLYAWVEFPFANPSVMLAFWTSLYAAARYAQLDARSADAANR